MGGFDDGGILEGSHAKRFEVRNDDVFSEERVWVEYVVLSRVMGGGYFS